MLKELAGQLVKEVKEKVPEIDITAGQATLISITTLRIMESHLRSRRLFNRAEFLVHAAKIIEGLLEEVPGGTE